MKRMIFTLLIALSCPLSANQQSTPARIKIADVLVDDAGGFASHLTTVHLLCVDGVLFLLAQGSPVHEPQPQPQTQLPIGASMAIQQVYRPNGRGHSVPATCSMQD